MVTALNMVVGREAWQAIVHGVTESETAELLTLSLCGPVEKITCQQRLKEV